VKANVPHLKSKYRFVIFVFLKLAPREKAAFSYSAKLKERFQHHPQLQRIRRYGHVQLLYFYKSVIYVSNLETSLRLSLIVEDVILAFNGLFWVF